MPTPSFDIHRFLSKNLKYPSDARWANKQGRVILQFTVTSIDEIKDVHVSTGVYPSLDSEAVRVARPMPHWNPAKQNGIPISVGYMMPILFRLE